MAYLFELFTMEEVDETKEVDSVRVEESAPSHECIDTEEKRDIGLIRSLLNKFVDTSR